MKKAMEQLNHETDIVLMVRERRLLRNAISDLLPASRLKEIRDQVEFLDVQMPEQEIVVHAMQKKTQAANYNRDQTRGRPWRSPVSDVQENKGDHDLIKTDQR